MVKEIKHPTLGIIAYYTGYIIVGMSLFMIFPALVFGSVWPKHTPAQR